MFSVQALSHGYDDADNLLNGVSFELAAGEALKVVGGNGCGKTTLLKILCRSLIPDDGRIRWRDDEVGTTPDEYWEELVYVSHKNALAEELSPLENLQSRACLRMRPPVMTPAAALSAAGVAEMEGRPCRLLSAGQRRRVALAVLPAFAAKLWLLDEPLAALDAAGRVMMTAWLAAHREQGGVAVVSMHDEADWQIPARTLRLSA